MRMARSVSMAAVLVGLCGAAASAADVQLLAGVGPSGAGIGPVAAQAASLTSIEHLSASPNGQVVLVGRQTGSPNQFVWVRSVDGEWRQRAATNLTTVPQLNNAPITGSLLGVPVLNSMGDLLLVSNVTSGATTPALVKIREDGANSLLLRFNAASGPGVPASGPVTFAGAAADAWRLSSAGTIFSSRAVGLFGSPVTSSYFAQLTAINTQNRTGSTGTALTVGSAGDAVTSASGWTAQRISTGAYGREDLAGLVMFDPMGVGTLAVRDRSTPVEGMLDQYVLSSAPTGVTTDVTSLGARIGINSEGVVAFVGRYGVPPPSSGLPTGGGTVPSTAGTLAVFTKSRGHGARIVADSTLNTLPGLEGWRFLSFGSPMINNKGQVTFSATLQGPAGTRSSIWTTDANGQLQLVALAGVPTGVGAPPADLGGVFTSFVTEPSINRQGQLSFQAITSAGLTLMAYDPATGLQTLARTNQSLRLPSGGTAQLQLVTTAEIGGRILLSTGNEDGLPTTITDTGKVVFRANVVGLGPAALIATIPTPTGACCVGSTCELRARFDCSRPGTAFVGDNTSCISIAVGTAGSCCPADFDHNGVVAQGDLFGFVESWIVRDHAADTDLDGSVTLGDLMGFIGEYVTGCAGHDDITSGPR